MYNTVMGVGAALILGGGVLYAGYQVAKDRDGERAEIAAEANEINARSERVALRPGSDARISRSGVPAGVGEPLDFDEGLDGDRLEITPTDEDLLAIGDLEAEIAAEDARLAALSGDDVDLSALPGEAQDRLEAGAAQAGELADGLARDGAEGVRGAARDARERAAEGVQNASLAAEDAGQDGLRGLRGAQDEAAEAAGTVADGVGDAAAAASDAADDVIARSAAARAAAGARDGGDGAPSIAAASSPDRQGADRQAADRQTADSQAAAAAATPRASAPAATVPNVRLTAKGDDGRYFTQNARQTDKPDQGGFAANTRQVDKPDNSPFYSENTGGDQFDPCLKADGTTYAGPGTAINPFADGDPCLPRATAQSFEVAQLVQTPPQATASDTSALNVASLPFVTIARPAAGFAATPPVGGGFGSDYRQ